MPILLFAFGAGVSLYQGILHVLNPEPVQHMAANYVVLGISALFTTVRHGGSRYETFRGERRYSEIVDAIRESKDPPSFMVLFEDSAALAGILVAFAGIYLSLRLNLPASGWHWLHLDWTDTQVDSVVAGRRKPRTF